MFHEMSPAMVFETDFSGTFGKSKVPEKGH